VQGISLELVRQALCAHSRGFRLQVIDGQGWVSGDLGGLDSRDRFIKLQIQVRARLQMSDAQHRHAGPVLGLRLALLK
jgi:hypothetical protein